MGILNNLKSAIGFSSDPDREFKEILNTSIVEYSKIEQYFSAINFSKISIFTSTVKNWDDNKKADFIVYLCRISKENESNWNSYNDKSARLHLMSSQYIQTLFKSKMKLDEKAIKDIYEAFNKYKSKNSSIGLMSWPLSGFLKQIENSFLPNELPASIKEVLTALTNQQLTENSYYYKDALKLIEKINSYLFLTEHNDATVRPTYFLGDDGFKEFANNSINSQPETDKAYWYQLLSLAQKATGSKPSKKYLNDAKMLVEALGEDKFKQLTHTWFEFIIHLKESITVQASTYNNQTYNYNIIEFLSSINADAIKGFVWMSSIFCDTASIHIISKLAERCFKKIPEKGPAAAGIGNACLYTLFTSKGLEGIAQLSRLKLKIKQNNTVSLIEKYIDEASAKLGISATEIEDLAVDEFQLIAHKRSFDFTPFTCSIELIGIGKSKLAWYKEDGSEQKTVPQHVKENQADFLKKVKDIQKQIDQTTSTQKERIDRMLRSNRVMSLEYFKEKYLQHTILSFVIDKVIFKFSNNTDEKLAIFINQKWIDLSYLEVDINSFSVVSLWHPVTSSTNEVKEWRSFLMDSQIQQPFKQAYREIYLLTDAEINTRTYSNRMASHILKQHQYVTLAKGRNWKARLIGAWDGGDQDTAELYLPEFKLLVEYWVNALNADDQYNDTGIWNYVTTDQIRFLNSETQELIELIDVHPIAFSEAMRDVDLFVGVASVGNDPTWSDSGGLPTYRDYWQAYSFGDLSEIAKNRKEILQGLIPRLKIASVAHIEDKFVVVKGKIRTYKIHIGSTNILMEPNDQYLCIVPDRSKKSEAEQVFLPFEGDNGLSVIISKAFLLANDDRITDSTITSQINR